MKPKSSKNDHGCIAFLQWALPRLRMRWPGFRKVRGQVCKRLARRIRTLGLKDLQSYRTYLAENSAEWEFLDTLCRVTISRFYRDRRVFSNLGAHVFPELLELTRQQGGRSLSCWCIGAASGEEPYSLSLLWSLSGFAKGETTLRILATEADRHMIDRAANACYQAASLKELPHGWREKTFCRNGDLFCLAERYRKPVRFLLQDIRKEQPPGPFHLIFCRNLVFTYYAPDLQKEIMARMLERLHPGGAFVIGSHEHLPPEAAKVLSPWLLNSGTISRFTGSSRVTPSSA
jgi:chemotaxis protein methyltransferase CheR